MNDYETTQPIPAQGEIPVEDDVTVEVLFVASAEKQRFTVPAEIYPTMIEALAHPLAVGPVQFHDGETGRLVNLNMESVAMLASDAGGRGNWMLLADTTASRYTALCDPEYDRKSYMKATPTVEEGFQVVVRAPNSLPDRPPAWMRADARFLRAEGIRCEIRRAD